jgi:DNA-directed RNA polymerase specialized sigma24 family protein
MAPRGRGPRTTGPELEARLARILEVLDEDRDRAAEKYEALRRKLTRFFEWRRGRFPDEMADEVMDRVGRRLAEGERIRSTEAPLYFLGVARNVLRESWARPESSEELTDEVAATASLGRDPLAEAEAAAGTEAWLACLDRCLERLPVESRRLVLLYHQDQRRARIDRRQELARGLGIGLNALRIRVFRLRGAVETCVRACIAADESATGEGHGGNG